MGYKLPDDVDPEEVIYDLHSPQWANLYVSEVAIVASEKWMKVTCPPCAGCSELVYIPHGTRSVLCGSCAWDQVAYTKHSEVE